MFAAVRRGELRLAAPSRFLEGRGSPADASAHAPRRDHKGYFLDPWNGPYFVFYDARRRDGALWSFGPDRRRDTRVRGMARPEPAGDDLLVWFSLPAGSGDPVEEQRPEAEEAEEAERVGQGHHDHAGAERRVEAQRLEQHGYGRAEQAGHRHRDHHRRE